MTSINVEGIEWTKATSKSGVDFQFGPRPENAANDETEVASEVPGNVDSDSAKGNGIEVRWEVMVNPGDDWIETSNEVKELGISKYRLVRTETPSRKDYILEFINTKGWGFTFIDETNDSYFVSTLRNGIHLLSYTSDEPTIIRVA